MQKNREGGGDYPAFMSKFVGRAALSHAALSMESLYQDIWFHGYWKLYATPVTTDGRPLEVVWPGTPNEDAGPDFSNAIVSVGGRRWAGNVEIHLRASDWFRHGHDVDPAYRNVVLHVVAKADMDVPGPDGSPIPTLEIPMPPELQKSFTTLCAKTDALKCADILPDMDSLVRLSWTDRMGLERLQTKAEGILDTLKFFNGDWEQTCFTVLARALGFGLNAQPFDILARNTPLSVLGKHSDDITQLEALIFGRAGMLDDSRDITDDYFRALCREFTFLSHKYSLRPLGQELHWKYARTRPANFPHRRLSLLAAYLLGGFRMFREIIDPDASPQNLERLFDIIPSDYWQRHFAFGSETEYRSPALSRQSLRLLTVNCAAPLRFAYGHYRGDENLCDSAREMLENLPAESNRIVRVWKDAGLPPANAFESQALLHLRREYCLRGRCLDCAWGYRMLLDQKPGPS